jgi:membrane-anchored glycerophosphoryl diester phosphodiesterase (GDPDase)
MFLQNLDGVEMAKKCLKKFFDSSKVTAAITSAGKAIRESWQTTKKNADLVENYIQKLD